MLKQKYLLVVAIALTLSVAATSCSNLPTTGETPEIGSIRVLHLSANAGTVDLLLDNRIVGDSVFAFLNRSIPGAVPRFTGPAVPYLGNTGYIGVEAGNRNLKVFAAPGGVAARPPLASPDPRVVAQADISVAANRAYTIFISDTVGTAGGIQPKVVQDDVPSFPDLTVFRGSIRFGHFSPNAPGVRVLITRTSSPGITNQELFGETRYKDVREFVPIDTGTFRIDIVAGTQTVTSATLTVAPRRVYTVLARGLVGASGAAALGVTSYLNN
ncbi:MAG: hypothetical protein CMR00_04350 [[Chlorobium] sp. 445]|nr:MAG: hypothetical protein CMR00_04350 [[Chlorobium] sp. 445]